MSREHIPLDFDDKLIEDLMLCYVNDELSPYSKSVFYDCTLEYHNENDLFLALGKTVFNEIVRNILREKMENES